jgi:hypothetical protein
MDFITSSIVNQSRRICKCGIAALHHYRGGRPKYGRRAAKPARVFKYPVVRASRSLTEDARPDKEFCRLAETYSSSI